MSTSSDQNQNVDEIRQRKKALRKEIRGRVKELSSDAIVEQSQKVWNRLFELPQYQSAKSVGLFLSMPNGEIKTDPALLHAIQNGKDIYVPEVGKNFEQSDMELRKVVVEKGGEQPSSTSVPSEVFHKTWPRNKWGIPEPPESMPVVLATPGELDLLITPGLAFDRNCNRMGQGKGYYDRFIARMTAEEGTKLPLIAVGLSPQLYEGDIPVDEYDQKMDMVLFPDEVIKSNSN